jgi:uncharacterized membrane protein
MNNDFLKLLFLNMGKTLGIALGLIIALFLLYFGILKTLFIAAFVILGFILGKWFDEGVNVKKFFKDIVDSFSENKWQ